VDNYKAWILMKEKKEKQKEKQEKYMKLTLNLLLTIFVFSFVSLGFVSSKYKSYTSEAVAITNMKNNPDLAELQDMYKCKYGEELNFHVEEEIWKLINFANEETKYVDTCKEPE
jgi:hypothetical protein